MGATAAADDTAANLAAHLHHELDEPALIVGSATITHRELAGAAARWRGGLQAGGVEAGDRVVILAGNDEVFVTGHLAAMGIGAMSVPINLQSPPAELAREIEGVRPAAIVVADSLRSRLEAALELLDGGTPRPLLLDRATLDAGEPAPLVEVELDTPAVLLFTSGTAGPPRPTVLTHGNLAAALQSVLSVPLDALRKPHVVLAVLPLFHVLGLNALLHLALLLRGSVVLADYRDGDTTVDLIERYRVTALSGPPNFWQALVAADNATPERLSSVEIAVSGAAALPASVFLAVGDRLGLKLEEGYGLTETAATVASTLGTRAPIGTVGRLLPGVEGRVVDDDGEDALVGDPGELWVRGAMVSPGYWRPEGIDPGPLLDDGWLPTGDLGMVDDFGHLAIVGRRKDMVIVSGFNVYPPEVERVLTSHPDVAEAGVVGEPSDVTGEAVVAFVVPRPGRDLDADELREHCRLELARYKVPSRMVIAADLPIGPTGKLQRNRLR